LGGGGEKEIQTVHASSQGGEKISHQPSPWNEEEKKKKGEKNIGLDKYGAIGSPLGERRGRVCSVKKTEECKEGRGAYLKKRKKEVQQTVRPGKNLSGETRKAGAPACC